MRTKTKIPQPSESESGEESSIIVEEHSVANYSLPPELMSVIRQACDIHLRNPKHLKKALSELKKNDPNFVRELFDESYISTKEEIPLSSMSPEQAKVAINEYIMNHPGCRTSEIAENLNIDPLEVVEILKELKKEGLVQSKAIE